MPRRCLCLWPAGVTDTRHTVAGSRRAGELRRGRRQTRPFLTLSVSHTDCESVASHQTFSSGGEVIARPLETWCWGASCVCGGRTRYILNFLCTMMSSHLYKPFRLARDCPSLGELALRMGRAQGALLWGCTPREVTFLCLRHWGHPCSHAPRVAGLATSSCSPALPALPVGTPAEAMARVSASRQPGASPRGPACWPPVPTTARREPSVPGPFCLVLRFPILVRSGEKEIHEDRERPRTTASWVISAPGHASSSSLCWPQSKRPRVKRQAFT